jgi:hypothetical protein
MMILNYEVHNQSVPFVERGLIIMINILNSKLHEDEKMWLIYMLSDDFKFRDVLVQQINCAEIEREYTDYFLSLKFIADKKN